MQSEQTARQQYNTILADFKKAEADYKALLADAVTADERKEAQSKKPNPVDYAERMFRIANDSPKDAVAYDALLWVMRNAGNQGGAITDKAIAQLARDHMDKPSIGEVCVSLMKNNSPGALSFMRAVLDKSSSKDAQGLACYALATSANTRSDQAARKGNLTSAGELSGEAAAMFQRIAKEFPDVTYQKKTLSETVKSELEELTLRGLGKTSPEITAEDIDGQSFKLSDYRGKVVLLDFWGHW